MLAVRPEMGKEIRKDEKRNKRKPNNEMRTERCASLVFQLVSSVEKRRSDHFMRQQISNEIEQKDTILLINFWENNENEMRNCFFFFK